MSEAPLPPSVFRRLQRYARTPGRDAREDRLTEALAATFEAAPDAARFVIGTWFGLETAGELVVTTQRWARSTERLDLELVFGSLNRPEARIWLESKVGAAPHRRQTERYLETLTSLPGREKRMSWLLPQGVAVGGGSPDGVALHTWQELANALDLWLQGRDDQSFDAGLVKQFVRHLEEEGVAVTQPLRPEDVAAVERYEAAAKRLNEFLRVAGDLIHAERAYIYGGSRPPAGLGFFEHVAHGARWSASAYFEWRGTHDGLRHSPLGQFAIAAGVSWKQGDEPSERDHPEWFDRRFREGFEHGFSRRKMSYLMRYLPLEDLAPNAEEAPEIGLTEQARLLADWALESWAFLERDPLPDL